MQLYAMAYHYLTSYYNKADNNSWTHFQHYLWNLAMDGRGLNGRAPSADYRYYRDNYKSIYVWDGSVQITLEAYIKKYMIVYIYANPSGGHQNVITFELKNPDSSMVTVAEANGGKANANIPASVTSDQANSANGVDLTDNVTVTLNGVKDPGAYHPFTLTTELYDKTSGSVVFRKTWDEKVNLQGGTSTFSKTINTKAEGITLEVGHSYVFYEHLISDELLVSSSGNVTGSLTPVYYDQRLEVEHKDANDVSQTFIVRRGGENPTANIVTTAEVNGGRASIDGALLVTKTDLSNPFTMIDNLVANVKNLQDGETVWFKIETRVVDAESASTFDASTPVATLTSWRQFGNGENNTAIQIPVDKDQLVSGHRYVIFERITSVTGNQSDTPKNMVDTDNDTWGEPDQPLRVEHADRNDSAQSIYVESGVDNPSGGVGTRSVLTTKDGTIVRDREDAGNTPLPLTKEEFERLTQDSADNDVLADVMTYRFNNLPEEGQLFRVETRVYEAPKFYDSYGNASWSDEIDTSNPVAEVVQTMTLHNTSYTDDFGNEVMGEKEVVIQIPASAWKQTPDSSKRYVITEVLTSINPDGSNKNMVDTNERGNGPTDPLRVEHISGLAIEQTFEVWEYKKDVTVNKAWAEALKGKEVPVEVQLYKRVGSEYVPVETSERADAIVTLSDSNGWTYTWKELPGTNDYDVFEITEGEWVASKTNPMKETEAGWYTAEYVLPTGEFVLMTDAPLTPDESLKVLATTGAHGDVTLKDATLDSDTGSISVPDQSAVFYMKDGYLYSKETGQALGIRNSWYLNSGSAPAQVSLTADGKLKVGNLYVKWNNGRIELDTNGNKDEILTLVPAVWKDAKSVVNRDVVNITNMAPEQPKVSVSKSWEQGADPKPVKVTLYADGVKVPESELADGLQNPATLSADGGWGYTWSGKEGSTYFGADTKFSVVEEIGLGDSHEASYGAEDGVETTVAATLEGGFDRSTKSNNAVVLTRQEGNTTYYLAASPSGSVSFSSELDPAGIAPDAIWDVTPLEGVSGFNDDDVMLVHRETGLKLVRSLDADGTRRLTAVDQSVQPGDAIGSEGSTVDELGDRVTLVGSNTKLWLGEDYWLNWTQEGGLLQRSGASTSVSAQRVLQAWTVSADSDQVRLTVTNAKTKTSFDLVKQDSTSKEQLAGATFSLYRADENGTDTITVGNKSVKVTKVTTVTTEKDAPTSFNDLSFGTYYLVEDDAPRGYEKLTEPIEFTLNKDANTPITLASGTSDKVSAQTSGSKGCLYVDNVSQSFELPYTGAAGAAAFTTVGLGTVVAAAGLARLNARKRTGAHFR